MSDDIPGLTEIERRLNPHKDKLNRIGYGAGDINACVEIYCSTKDKFKEAIDKFLECLKGEKCSIRDYIHSIKDRPKDPYHLIDKLLRKALPGKDSDGKVIKRKIITSENFLTLNGVTDLWGVRILHVYKYQWRKIHEHLLSLEGYHFHVKEMKAYKRDDDPVKYVSKTMPNGKSTGYPFPTDGFPVQAIIPSKKHYTSLHYTFQFGENTKPDIFFECQVRTLFEEGWGEIDHQRSYPHGATTVVRSQLELLNKAATMADNIASTFEQIDRLPLFVPWEMEQAFERLAEFVNVFSLDLYWAANNIQRFVQLLKESKTIYTYYVPDSLDATLLGNRTIIQDALKRKHLYWRVNIVPVPSAKIDHLPIFSDLLLIDTTYDLTGQQMSLAVVGTPKREDEDNPPQEQQLDMLIQEEIHVNRLKKFFETLKGLSAS